MKGWGKKIINHFTEHLYPSAPEKMVYSLNSKGASITNLESGQTRTIPLGKTLAATVDASRGLLFYSTKEGVFRQNLFSPGNLLILYHVKDNA